MCAFVNSELQAKYPNLVQLSQTWPWEECKGIFKQSYLQKSVMLSVYWEHEDKVVQFAAASAAR